MFSPGHYFLAGLLLLGFRYDVDWIFPAIIGTLWGCAIAHFYLDWSESKKLDVELKLNEEWFPNFNSEKKDD